ncbi:MAG: heptosyltransferase [Stygiobacter sp. RIFOXYC12_FULL_38_8]|nr:MAG: heptosyltransferase [Stygiobacter sp. GWC2_38_9]OGU82542.1 MAG: heptosyltransferase [Stygiobacter sp. RIFOXYA12_FULL_38_9]OGV08405.1 MAG: heptosyltransferase [Stygiobacter sp. RIFOXYB2_FULL_37_11]OGV14967.1 MAG: heptosyltransferase [Stygiobacter sp. RIFOXYC2_FULL_38_25]OGV17154.1 MAG: heptosyltransferase [Stygiobacter sp. RIFOXYA2_FULL_38_8]OGV23620.1 MAG: heptosyltransferase [Stygiobacter sp. RIFOXYC12_FULL_38_8]OGV79443.1 MAG: heptosyltransferase [Stygiobacter sp. GWF2_38_21]RJQ599
MDFNELKIPKCKKFNGYKPCVSYKNCLEEGCQADCEENQIGTKILMISLDALGTVLMNTAILPSIKRKFPVSTIYWITMPAAEKILFNNPLIDKVLTWTDENRMVLRQIKFDYAYNTDKSNYACAFLNEVTAENKLGFVLNDDGKIVPANKSAMYSYILGVDDNLKFRINQRSGLDIVHEVLELDYKKDEYIFEFTEEEKQFIENFKQEINYDSKKYYVGFNTGCSNLFPNKKMTVEQHVHLIKEFAKDDNLKIVLFGGREDTERNQQIMDLLPADVQAKVLNTPSTLGLRRGACFMSIADLVITGDSFGMHMAIGLKKYVIAWFGLSCVAEIEIYGRGEKVYQKDLECSPCWEKTCPYNLECISMIDLDKIVSLAKQNSLLKN